MRAARVVPLALLFLAFASGAAAAKTDVSEKTLAIGQFVEVDLALQAGEQVAWKAAVLTPGAQATFNIHTHHGDGTVENFEDRNLTGSIEGSFRAPGAGTYSWLVQNTRHTGDLDARIETTRADRGMPGFEPMALGLAALAVAAARRRLR